MSELPVHNLRDECTSLKAFLIIVTICLAAAWGVLTAMLGESESEKLIRSEDQLRSAAGLAQAVLAPKAAALSSNMESANSALEDITSRSLILERAYLVVPTSRGWRVAGDTSGSVSSIVLPTQSQSRDLYQGRTILRQGLTLGNGQRSSAAYVPLIQNGQLLGFAGLIAQPSLQSGASDIQIPIMRALLILGATGVLFGLIYVWSKGRPLDKKSPERRFVGLEAAVVALVCWSAYHAIEAQAKLHHSSTVQQQHVRLAEGISRAISVVDLKPSSQPVIDAAEGLKDTIRPWLSQSFLQGMAESDQKSLITLLAHQSVVTSSQLQRTREIIAEASRTTWQNLVILAAAALALFMLVQSKKSRERQLMVQAMRGEETKAHLDRLVDHMPIGLAAFTATQIEDSNPAWRSLLGPVAESSDSDWAKWIHPSDLPKVLTALSAEPAENEFDGAPIPCRILSPDGQTRHLALRLSSPGSTEQLKGRRLVFALDVTEEQAARLALKQQTELTEQKNALLASALDELEDNIGSVVHCLVKAVEAKDPYTAGHSERVAEYCLRIGRYLGLGPFELRILELGALIHDVGKIGIPDDILLKPGRLSPEEYDTIKTHPQVGEEILSKFSLFNECLPIVRWHHERLDGTGYPDQLTGEEIPFLVRISAVADAFDAMTSTRAYRDGMDPAKALDLLVKDAEEGKLDSMIVEALRRITSELGIIPQVDRNSPSSKAA